MWSSSRTPRRPDAAAAGADQFASRHAVAPHALLHYDRDLEALITEVAAWIDLHAPHPHLASRGLAILWLGHDPVVQDWLQSKAPELYANLEQRRLSAKQEGLDSGRLARERAQAWQGNVYAGLLDEVQQRTARLLAQWQAVGFCHGVMNTDNMSISGETIDYGPCAFMEGFDPATVFSSIDRQGRYAYGQQPAMAQWNLARLAEALLPVLDARDIDVVERVEQVVAGFAVRFDRHWTGQLRAKLGLAAEEPDDRALADDFLQLLQREKVDFTLAFRLLSDAITGPDAALHDLFGRERPALSDWLARWRQRMAREGRTLQDCAATAWSVNPFVIPRNHQVEAALSSAVDEADLGPFERLLAVLGRPYETVESARPFTLPASPEVAAAHRTFCGT